MWGVRGELHGSVHSLLCPYLEGSYCLVHAACPQPGLTLRLLPIWRTVRNLDRPSLNAHCGLLVTAHVHSLFFHLPRSHHPSHLMQLDAIWMAGMTHTVTCTLVLDSCKISCCWPLEVGPSMPQAYPSTNLLQEGMFSILGYSILLPCLLAVAGPAARQWSRGVGCGALHHRPLQPCCHAPRPGRSQCRLLACMPTAALDQHHNTVLCLCACHLWHAGTASPNASVWACAHTLRPLASFCRLQLDRRED